MVYVVYVLEKKRQWGSCLELKRQAGKIMNYPIGDFLIQIKNAYQARKVDMSFGFSNTIFSIGKILEKEGYVGKVSEVKDENWKKIHVVLKYDGKMPALSEIKLISRPSVHHYINKHEVKRAVPAHGMGILSTSKGIMTSVQAKKEGVGGELIAQIF